MTSDKENATVIDGGKLGIVCQCCITVPVPFIITNMKPAIINYAHLCAMSMCPAVPCLLTSQTSPAVQWAVGGEHVFPTQLAVLVIRS